jgi:hypothetical protein
MRELGNLDRREMGRWKNNRAENSHLPFRRRERAMLRFRRMKTLQKFASVHASVHNHFNHERHLVDRQTYKIRRAVALAEWPSLAAQNKLNTGSARQTEASCDETNNTLHLHETPYLGVHGTGSSSKSLDVDLVLSNLETTYEKTDGHTTS